MFHNVYFWLKKDLSPAQRATFESELQRLAKTGYLAQARIGKPAPTEPRPVTDHSFDYAFFVEFKSMEDHDFYQKGCTDHERFVQICKPFFDRVIVYDSTALA
jgi:hypothetical protein